MPGVRGINERRTTVLHLLRQWIEHAAAGTGHVHDIAAILIFDPTIIRTGAALVVVEPHHLHVPD
jgi:hypothetical protein